MVWVRGSPTERRGMGLETVMGRGVWGIGLGRECWSGCCARALLI